MSDGFPDRLTQLRARWQGDPSSRVFLQLAEEYRHLGRVQEALEVLQRGLQEHPGYLSALVAKGRCLLELGDAAGARGVLERVVQQDATQMVANKLLVRACLETGEPERARERLDLYTLLNDSDPEIEELRRRVVAMSRPPQAADEPRWEEAAEGSPMSGTEMPAGKTQDVFDLGSPAPVRAPVPVEDSVFDLAPAPPAPPATVQGPVAAAPTAVAAGEAVGAAAAGWTVGTAPAPAGQTAAPVDQDAGMATAGRAAGMTPRGHGTGAEPFPDLAPAQSWESYLAGLAAEQIFAFETPAGPAAAVVAPPAPAPVAAGWEARPAEPFELGLPAAAWASGEAHEAAAAAGADPVVGASADPVAGAGEAEVPAADGAAVPAAAAAEAAPTWMQAASAPFAVEAVEEVAAEGLAPASAAGLAPFVATPAEVAPASAAGLAAFTATPAEERPAAASDSAAVFGVAAGPGVGGAAGRHGTATLGELYLRQGHLGEAERIFQEVLHREPQNVVALGALDEIERRRKPLDAATLLAGHGEPDAPLATRKAYVLRGYLTRLRQAGRPHVP